VQKYARASTELSRIVRNPTRMASLMETMMRLFGGSVVGKREIDAAVRVILAADRANVPRGEKARTSPPGRTPPVVRSQPIMPPVTATVVGPDGLRRPMPMTDFPAWDKSRLPIIDAEIVEATGGEAVDPKAENKLRQAAAEVIRTPGSSNVHSFYFVKERRHNTKTGGILYVTFLAWSPGMKAKARKGAGPGPTYAYYGMPIATYKKFKHRAMFKSAGKAVWDFLRMRGAGNQARSQYPYQLTRVSALGEPDLDAYVPRKITRKGLRTRNLPDLTGRSTLAPRDFKVPLSPREPRTVRGKTVYR
jgi:hypothetical protein